MKKDSYKKTMYWRLFFSEHLCFRQDSTNARIHFPREYLASSLCSISGIPRKGREGDRALRKEEKSFYKFHSLPFAFLLCPTTLNFQRLRSCPEIAPFSKSVSTRANPAYSLDPVSFRFSLSRPISAEDIRSAIRAQNLNKTNQYSNPPLSLADSPSVPFSAFLLTSFYFLLYLFLFIFASY